MKLFLLLILFPLFSSITFAQVADSTEVVQESENKLPKTGLDKTRIYYGGYVTMSISKNYSVIGAQPLVGYKLTPKLSVGAQVSYEYVSEKRYNDDLNGSNYGFSIFNRFRFSPCLYSHAEFSLMSYKWFYTDGSEGRKLAPMLYLGGGYNQPIAKNTWLNTQVLFDVLNHENSPYRNWKPYFSIGIGVGF